MKLDPTETKKEVDSSLFKLNNGELLSSPVAVSSIFTNKDNVVLEGYLRKQARNFGRDWHRRYFVLTHTALSYYSSPQYMEEARCEIPLISVSVKALPVNEKMANARRFRLLTPTREFLLEAETEEEASTWINELLNTIGSLIHKSSIQQVPIETAGLVSGSKELYREIKSIPGNEFCADCGSSDPCWVTINLGVVLCIDCSGVHRSLGCQISRVRSLEYDVFHLETVRVLKLLGNTHMNGIWEQEDYAHRKAQICSTTDRKEYICDKYIKRAFTGERKTTSLVTSPRTLATLFSPELELFQVVQTSDVCRTAELLHRFGVDVNLRNGTDGETPLHRAAQAGQLLQAHFLLLNGANSLMLDVQGMVPSEVAKKAGHYSLASHLNYFQVYSGAGNRDYRSSSTSSCESKDDQDMTKRIKEGFHTL